MPVLFSIPNIFDFYKVNIKVIEILSDREYIVPGYHISDVHGSFPNAIWNGGVNIVDTVLYDNIHECVDIYNNHRVSCRMTFTNSLVEEKHLDERLCNIIMEAMSVTGINLVETIPGSPLSEYLEERYPNCRQVPKVVSVSNNLEIPSSMDNIAFYTTDVPFDYESIDKELRRYIEIPLNPYCPIDCDRRAECYLQRNIKQMTFARTIDVCKYQKNIDFVDCLSHSGFITKDMVTDLIRLGYSKFKIFPRTINNRYSLLESYIYYFVKPEYANYVRLKVLEEIK